jgi:hypothetical protein
MMGCGGVLREKERDEKNAIVVQVESREERVVSLVRFDQDKERERSNSVACARDVKGPLEGSERG